MHVHDLAPFGNATFNFSHTINRLQFGESFPGAVNQLDGQSRVMKGEGSGVYQYFVKVREGEERRGEERRGEERR